MSEEPKDTTTTEEPPVETQEEVTESDWSSSIPEKFRRDTAEETAAELARSFTELEKKLGERQRQDGLRIDPDKPGKKIESTSDIVKAAGLKITDLERQYIEHGSLSDEQYKAFEDAGYSRGFVDEIVTAREQGKKQRIESIHQAMADEVGGTQELDVILAKAKSLPDEVRQSYNVLISANGAGPAQARHAIRLIKAALDDSTPGKPADPSSAPAAAKVTGGFKTKAEWAKATRQLARAQDSGQPLSKDMQALQARVLATPDSVKKGY